MCMCMYFFYSFFLGEARYREDKRGREGAMESERKGVAHESKRDTRQVLKQFYQSKPEPCVYVNK